MLPAITNEKMAIIADPVAGITLYFRTLDSDTCVFATRKVRRGRPL